MNTALLRRAAPLLFLASTALAGQPVATPGATVDTYFGVTVEDPYRNLENLADPGVKNWVSGQATYTRNVLDALPGLPSLRSRIDALDAAAGESVRFAERASDGTVFFMKRLAGAALPGLYMRKTDGTESLLLDTTPAPGSKESPRAINRFAVAPDGKHVAVIISQSDSEFGDLLVMNVASRKFVGKPIPDTMSELPPYWFPDSRRFAYTFNTSPKEGYGQYQLRIRDIGGKSADRPLFGWQLPGPIQTRKTDWIWAAASSASPYVLAYASEGINSTIRAWAMPRARYGRNGTLWRPLVDEQAKVRSVAHAGQWLYLRSFDGASRFRILRVDLANPNARPVEVVPQQAGVIEDIGAGQDALYYIVRTGAVGELFALPHGRPASEARKIAMPAQGTLTLVNTNPALPGALFLLEPWTSPAQVWSATLAEPSASDARLVKAGAAMDGVEALETFCTADDGARIPVSILTKRGLPRNGSNPTLLNGYGGYGYTVTAYYAPATLAFLERGGVLAVANPRGSGAYGEDWYQAGVGPTKENTWKDMNACARMLVKEGYTSASRLGIRGISMGGVAAGRAMTSRPDLYAVAILQVGVLDTVRSITNSPNGPLHKLEMGDVTSEQGVRQLLAMSTYHHVKAGEKYPATLLVVGMNDMRVDPWSSFKTAARLQASSASGKPVLLRVDEEAGHGVSATASQRNATVADMYAFLLWQAGAPDFQPPTTASTAAGGGEKQASP